MRKTNCRLTGAGGGTLADRALRALAPVGYLHLRQFINCGTDTRGRLSLVSQMPRPCLSKKANVTDLIIDLRYNGGGLLSVADTMMDLLAGITATGEALLQDSGERPAPRITTKIPTDYWVFLTSSLIRSHPFRIAFITSRSPRPPPASSLSTAFDPHIDAVMVGAQYLWQAGRVRAAGTMHELVSMVLSGKIAMWH